MANVQALQRQGWYLSPEGITECTENGRGSVEDIIRIALNLDLRTIGERHLPDGVNRAKIETVDGPKVVQIQKVRNVTAPKDNEDSQAAPPMLKLTLTDGHNTCTAIEFEKISRLTLDTPPGTKLELQGKVPVNQGLLLLTGSNARLLGGKVEKLIQNWELKRSLAKHTRATVSGTEGGPPPFIPFGQKHRDAPQQYNTRKADNFRSLDKGKEKKEEDTEFQQLRQASIKAALKDGEAEKKKSFGGKNVSDKDIAKVVEMGFPPEMASNALRQCNGNIEEAIHMLLQGGGGEMNHYGNSRPMRGHDRGRGRGGSGRGGRGGRDGPMSIREDSDDRPGRGDRSERGGRGRRGREEEGGEYTQPSRPSGPATIFDFLNAKMPIAKEEPKQTESREVVVTASNSGISLDSEISSASSASSRRCLPNLPPRLQRQQQQQQQQPQQRGPQGYPRSTNWEEDQSWGQSRGGHQSNRGRGGHESRGRGGPDSRGRGERGNRRGGYGGPRNQGGHWSNSMENYGYQDHYSGGRNRYDNSRGGRGHHDNSYGGRGHSDNSYNDRSHNDGSYNSRRGHYDNSYGGRGHYDNSYGGRGQYDHSRGGRSHDNNRSHDNSRSHDNNRSHDNSRSQDNNRSHDNSRSHDNHWDSSRGGGRQDHWDRDQGPNHWDNKQGENWTNHSSERSDRRGARNQSENWTGTQEWVNSSRKYQADWASQGDSGFEAEASRKTPTNGQSKDQSTNSRDNKDNNNRDNRGSARDYTNDRKGGPSEFGNDKKGQNPGYNNDPGKGQHQQLDSKASHQEFSSNERKVTHQEYYNDRKYGVQSNNDWTAENIKSSQSQSKPDKPNNESSHNGVPKPAVISSSSIDDPAVLAEGQVINSEEILANSRPSAVPAPTPSSSSENKVHVETTVVSQPPPIYASGSTVIMAAPPIMATPVMPGMATGVPVSQPPPPVPVQPTYSGQPVAPTYTQQSFAQPNYQQTYAQPMYQQAYAPAPQQQASTVDYTAMPYSQLPPHLMQQMSDMSLSSASYIPQADPAIITTMTVPGGPAQPAQVATAPRQVNSRQWKPGDQCFAKFWQDHKFYRAIIHQVNLTNQSLLVQFTDYGNCEEVPISEATLEMPKETWNAYGARPAATVSTMSAVMPQMPGMMVQGAPNSSMTFQLAYPAAMATTPTDQPFQGQIGTMEFYPSGGNPAAVAAYAGRPQQQQSQQRRPQQQVYTNIRNRPL